MDYLEIRLLKPLPKKIRDIAQRSQVIAEDMLEGLDDVYDVRQDDPRRVTLKVKSVYASHEDIIKYVSEANGRQDDKITASSISYGDPDVRGVQIRYEDGAYLNCELSRQAIREIEKEHVDERRFEIVRAKYTLDIGYRDYWMHDVEPCYLSEKVIRELLRQRVEWANKLSDTDLSERLDDELSGMIKADVFGFMCDCLEKAKREKCAAWLSPVY